MSDNRFSYCTGDAAVAYAPVELEVSGSIPGSDQILVLFANIGLGIWVSAFTKKKVYEKKARQKKS